MNKKQYTSLILALLIMGTRIGFALNVHYCGHQIAEISLASNPSNCGMEINQDNQLPEHTSFSKTPCCKDQTLLFQNNEPQKFETVYNLAFFGFDKSSLTEDLLKVPTLISRVVLKMNWNPPPPGNNKVYLLNHSFVVYG
ncbi:MAG: HYC_CC_PP family protein [Flavobacteriaceae bacterium]